MDPTPERSAVVTVLALLSLLGCSRSPFASSAPPDASAPDPLEVAACAGRTGCSLREKLPIGAAPDGRTRVAVVAVVPGHPSETWLLARGPAVGERIQLLATDSSQLEILPSGELRTRRVLPARAALAGSTGQPPPRPDAFDFAFDPPRLVRQTGPGPLDLRWDWAAFRGESKHTPVLPVAHVAEDGFATDGWKTSDFGTCAAVLRSAASRASVRFLLSEKTLYVEVHDVAFSPRKGTVADALVLRGTSADSPNADEGWSEQLRMDGTWVDRSGHTHAVPMVEVSPSVRRFAWKGVLPPRDGEVVRIVYVNTDDGLTEKERVTLPDTDGRATHLAVVDLAPPAQCATQGGELRPAPVVGTGIDVPILP